MNAPLAAVRLSHGSAFPYDAPDSWWEDGDGAPLPSLDWAHLAARGVLADLCDRSAIKHGFAGVSEDVRAEIVATLAEIIRLAAPSTDGEGR